MDKKEDLRVIKTKKSLYDGLLIMMKDKPFEDIKVADICRVALTNRSTFYDHFNDKYELLYALMKDMESALVDKLKSNTNISNTKDFYMKMIELLFEHISENVSFYSSIIKNNNNSVANDMIRNTLLMDVRSHIESEKNYNSEVPAEVLTMFYVSAVINVCSMYLREPNKYTKNDILNYLDELLPDNLY